MNVLFDPSPPSLRCCVYRNGKPIVHNVKLEGHWAETITGHLGPATEVEAVGYVLHNGGNQIKDAVSLLSGQALQRIKRCVHLLPEYNSMTLALAEYGMKQWPKARHMLLCDTAFFARLSPVVRNYAIPYELTRRGLGRYGAFGLCHEWIWKQTRAQPPDAAKKVISIFLGDHTSLAAINNGIPKETTTGLTALEGIMSASGCGDIDPTIIFLLKTAGLSYSAINRILCNESGFAAMASKPCTLSDIVSGPSAPELVEAKHLLRYQIIKQIGAMLTLLGGVDAITFASEKPQDMTPLALEISEAFTFLGVRCRADTACDRSLQELSVADSAVRVYNVQYDRWSMMKEAIASFVKTNQEKKYEVGKSISR